MPVSRSCEGGTTGTVSVLCAAAEPDTPSVSANPATVATLPILIFCANAFSKYLTSLSQRGQVPLQGPW